MLDTYLKKNFNYKIIALIVLLIFVSLVYIFVKRDEKSENHEILMREDTFYPRFIEIKEGDEVTFENKSTQDHWPASNIHPTHDIYPEFDSKQEVKPNQSWKFKFSKIGQWRFHDHLNSTISGEISVRPNSSGILGIYRNSIYNQSDILLNTNSWLISKWITVYYYFIGDNKENYLNNQNIKNIIDKSDNIQLGVLLRLFGPGEIIKHLFVQSGEGKKYNCHTPSHQVGRIAYKVLGDQALGYNINLCASGYSHGMMAAFVSGLSDEEVVSKIREKCSSLSPLFLRINCFHGSGHGLMAYYNYDLPKSLKSCQSIGEYYSTGNCLVGVFMENIGTQFGDSLSHRGTEWLDKNNPHFPCDSIDQSYQVQRTCYAIQPGWMTYLFNKDVKKTVAACLELNNEIIADCFFGYGQTVGLMANYNPGMSVLLCESVPNQSVYRNYCYAGVAMDLILFWGPDLGNRGDDFCKVVPAKNREACKEYLITRTVNFNK